MSRYFPKPGENPGPTQENKKSLERKYGAQTAVYEYRYKSGRMYPVRYVLRYGHLYMEYDPRDIRNQPPNTKYPNPFTGSGRDNKPKDKGDTICEDGAVCCVETSCYDTGGCGGGIGIGGKRFCNEFCQGHYEEYGVSPDGCPEPYDSKCFSCSELTDTLDERAPTPNLHCTCGQAIPPTDCVRCNSGTGVWESSPLCRKPPPPEIEECECFRTGCKTVQQIIIDPWYGSTPCPSQDGLRLAAYIQGDNKLYCLYCKNDDFGEEKCINSVTGEPCCPKGSVDKCTCRTEGDTQRCYKACSPDKECDPIDDETECTLPNGDECEECEICDSTDLICVPDPGCGEGCGSIDLEGKKSKPCTCNDECNTCELCNGNGRCYPDPSCIDCIPPI